CRLVRLIVLTESAGNPREALIQMRILEDSLGNRLVGAEAQLPHILCILPLEAFRQEIPHFIVRAVETNKLAVFDFDGNRVSLKPDILVEKDVHIYRKVCNQNPGYAFRKRCHLARRDDDELSRYRYPAAAFVLKLLIIQLNVQSGAGLGGDEKRLCLATLFKQSSVESRKLGRLHQQARDKQIASGIDRPDDLILFRIVLREYRF